MAERAFRSCYKDLMRGITDPNDVPLPSTAKAF